MAPPGMMSSSIRQGSLYDYGIVYPKSLRLRWGVERRKSISVSILFAVSFNEVGSRGEGARDLNPKP